MMLIKEDFKLSKMIFLSLPKVFLESKEGVKKIRKAKSLPVQEMKNTRASVPKME